LANQLAISQVSISRLWGKPSYNGGGFD
jgi:hypothetical protein